MSLVYGSILVVVVLTVIVLIVLQPGGDDTESDIGEIREPVTEPDIDVPVDEGVPGQSDDEGADEDEDDVTSP